MAEHIAARDTYYSSAKELLLDWLEKQGHERCWYYPDIFRKLCDLFGIKTTADKNLPPRAEFEQGCKRYQDEEYPK